MKKIFIILVSTILSCAIALSYAGCVPRGNNGNTVDNNGIIDEDITVEGIDKKDVYTWFDMNKTDLPDLEACQEITEGMSLNQVIKKLGRPQRDIGDGAVLLQFDLNDASILTITFVKDSEKMISKPNLSTYDYLVVYSLDFGQGIPDVYFPYYGTLNDLYQWIDELNAEDIVKVRCESSHCIPGMLNDISYSTNSVDIENAYRLLFSPLKAITEEESHIAGGGLVKYDFYTADNVYSVSVGTNMVQIDNRYYKFVDTFYYAFRYPDLVSYSFDTLISAFDEYEIYTYAETKVKVGDYTDFSKFEFCVYDGVIDKIPRFYLRSSVAVNLLILSPDLFMIEGGENTVVYRITGEKDFSSLFADN